MQYFELNVEKDEELREEGGITFEEVVFCSMHGGLWGKGIGILEPKSHKFYKADTLRGGGIGERCPALVDDDLQVDEDLRYREEHIVLRHKGKYIVDEIIEGARLHLELLPHQIHALIVVQSVGRYNIEVFLCIHYARSGKGLTRKRCMKIGSNVLP